MILLSCRFITRKFNQSQLKSSKTAVVFVFLAFDLKKKIKNGWKNSSSWYVDSRTPPPPLGRIGLDCMGQVPPRRPRVCGLPQHC